MTSGGKVLPQDEIDVAVVVFVVGRWIKEAADCCSSAQQPTGEVEPHLEEEDFLSGGCSSAI